MKIWLDDVQTPPNDDWVWVRTATYATVVILTERVSEISFDHDLGKDMPTGYDLAKAIEKKAYLGEISPMIG